MTSKQQIDLIDIKINNYQTKIDSLEKQKQIIYDSCVHSYKRQNVYDPYDDLYICIKCGKMEWR